MASRSPWARRGLSRAVGTAAIGLLAAACDRGAPPRSAPLALTSSPPRGAPATVPLLTSADVDARLRAEWTTGAVAPTPPAPDATWLRRLWVDVGGTIPPPDVVRRFLADRSEGKRARAIDELLASPRWAVHWTAYWDDVWMGRDTRGPDVDAGAFRGWLHDALARNTPWNDVVTQLLTATGRNSGGGAKREAEANEGSAGAPAGVNGAVNWVLKYAENPAGHGRRRVTHAARGADPVRAVPRPQDGEVDAEGLPGIRRDLHADALRGDRSRATDGDGAARRRARSRTARRRASRRRWATSRP